MLLNNERMPVPMFKQFRRMLFFNLRYLGRPRWDTGVSPPELKAFLETAKPGSALDLGCGTGTNMITLLDHGWTVTGVDEVWIAVLRARKKLRIAGYRSRVIRGNVAGKLLPDQHFDLVLDIGCYHSLHEKPREKYLQNLRRWLKKRGTFLIYAHRKNTPDAKHGITEADLARFQDFLKLNWQKNDAEKRPDGGSGRAATWARFDRD
jgi:SAM-dependent methyltransferase